MNRKVHVQTQVQISAHLLFWFGHPLRLNAICELHLYHLFPLAHFFSVLNRDLLAISGEL